MKYLRPAVEGLTMTDWHVERAAREARDAALAALVDLENLFHGGMFWGTSVWTNHPRLKQVRTHLLEAEYELREAIARLDDDGG
jgi:hypothetical protein